MHCQVSTDLLRYDSALCDSDARADYIDSHVDDYWLEDLERMAKGFCVDLWFIDHRGAARSSSKNPDGLAFFAAEEGTNVLDLLKESALIQATYEVNNPRDF